MVKFLLFLGLSFFITVLLFKYFMGVYKDFNPVEYRNFLTSALLGFAVISLILRRFIITLVALMVAVLIDKVF